MDHGRGLAGLTWSPDGRFLLYSLSDDGGGSDVWWLRVSDGATGRLTTSRLAIAPDWSAAVPTTASEPDPEAATGLVAYPSPTREPITVAFDLPEAGDTRVAVVDALGREVAVLYEGALAAGPVRLGASLAGLPAGAYVVVLRTEAGARATRPVIVVR